MKEQDPSRSALVQQFNDAFERANDACGDMKRIQRELDGKHTNIRFTYRAPGKNGASSSASVRFGKAKPIKKQQ